ncbi:hypothetical protein [Moritella yayanosii]|uniref:Uncharacterized protein n=1 Tax=Moritella yayanosii TaxID=69539 RepID=A0A330LJ60_9GAMM|nr:hypothetical protein [Moritella yayanosii]SQD76890.1 conserved protein of unknown function [Moritella yayanosii]
MVDIVNQTDYNESPNGEDKLGQPMFRLGINIKDALLEAMILIGYREAAMALRYSKIVKNIDVGVSYFGGHSRTPELIIPDVGDPVWHVNFLLA